MPKSLRGRSSHREDGAAPPPPLCASIACQAQQHVALPGEPCLTGQGSEPAASFPAPNPLGSPKILPRDCGTLFVNPHGAGLFLGVRAPRVPWQWFGWRVEWFAPAPSASLGAPSWQRGHRCRAGFSPSSGEVRAAGAPLPPPQFLVGSRSYTRWGRLHQMFLPSDGWGENRLELKNKKQTKET